MKGNRRTLRQMMALLSVVAVILPFSLFEIASQFQVWHMSGRTMERQMSSELDKINQSIDLMLGRYESILRSFCTDEGIIQLADGLAEDSSAGADSHYKRQLRRQMMHICNRNEGIEGMTLVARDRKVYFYDRIMASSINSNWADRLYEPDENRGGAHYHGGRFSISTESGTGSIIQISRPLVDYLDINRELGTAILSINADMFTDVVSMPRGSLAFVCEGDRIILSGEKSFIGRSIDSVSQSGQKIQSRRNESSGWTLYYYQSMREYWRPLVYQSILWLLTSLLTAGGLIGLIWRNTRPMMDAVNGLMEAMNDVEEGDFTVNVREDWRSGAEICRIAKGFNRMVLRLGQMVEQVRQAAVEQKNAELSAMEAQIDPHFLYNTLDTINWKALEQEQYEISGMVGDLADILRYSIRNPGEMVSVGQELSWLRQYLHLQAARLDRKLELEILVKEELEGYRIHKLLLQPLVENSIKHGFPGMDRPYRMRIRMTRSQDQLHISIKDNGRGIPREALDGLNREDGPGNRHVGVANVRKRLRLYYGDDATLYFESEENAYTRVHLFVPLIQTEKEDA